LEWNGFASQSGWVGLERVIFSGSHPLPPFPKSGCGFSPNPSAPFSPNPSLPPLLRPQIRLLRSPSAASVATPTPPAPRSPTSALTPRDEVHRAPPTTSAGQESSCFPLHRRHHRQWPHQAPRRRHDLRVAAGFAPFPRLTGLPSLLPVAAVPLFVDWYFP